MRVLSVTMLAWAKAMFGDVAMDPRERALRMLEEACELAQAADLEYHDCVRVAQRAWSRPKDTVHKELGAVLVTVLAMAAVYNENPEQCLLDEMQRILSKPSKHWRDKHDAKVGAGTTTGPVVA